MVSVIKNTKVMRLVLSLLIITIATNTSALSYSTSEQGTYLSRLTHYSNQPGFGEVMAKGIRNLFKKIKKNPKDIVLVVSGEGCTKDEATKVALRSAIEQAFGTFISSNTEILNDNLVKDEIITVSSGNIKSYNYISESQTNGKWNVTLQAIVSLGKLTSYVQQKGGETELAGATYAMDVKMKKLYKQNEEIALRHLMTQLNEIVPQMFDYSIKAGSPQASRNGERYYISVEVTISTNKNYTHARELILNTLGALCIKDKDEISDLKEKGLQPIHVSFYNYSNREKSVNTGLPLTYMRFPWNTETPKQYVFFRSGQFFSDLSKLIREVLGYFTIDVGFKKISCAYDNIDKGRFIQKPDYYYRGPDGDNIVSMGYAYASPFYFFPVAKSAKWKLEGNISFTLEELERVTNIKVHSGGKRDFPF